MITWNEVLELLAAYNKAVEEEDEESIVHICNVLPEEIRFAGNEIHICI